MVGCFHGGARLSLAKQHGVDPETIIDRATVSEPAQTSIGVHYLIVNGQILINDGELDQAIRPGQPIRRPIKTN